MIFLSQACASKFQPEFVVDSFDELSEMSAWLGERCHYFDEISLSVRDNAPTFQTRPRNPRLKDVHTGTKSRLDVKS
jgi:hypothetical protein